MKYLVIEKEDHLLIKISGDARKNEALLVKRMLYPYLRKKDLKVIVELDELGHSDPTILISVLNGIKKETTLFNGQLTLYGLKPEIIDYLTKHRLGQVFKV